MSKPIQATLKAIPLYEELYSMDILKNVYSHITNQYLSPFETGFGEICVTLFKDGGYVSHQIEHLYIITHQPKEITAEILERFERRAINQVSVKLARDKRMFKLKDILSIRERYNNGEAIIYELFDEYDVVYLTILNIVSYQTYKDIF